MIIVILSFTFLGIRKTFHFHYDLDHILRGRWELKWKTESVTIETVKRQHLSLSELSKMDHRISLAIILVIVVVLEIFLLTMGKIFWIVNAALLVSFTAIGMIWKEEWKMTLSRYHWTASGPQVWEERTASPLTRFPDPLAFGSGSGLQCVYSVVISLWGTPAAKFVLESPKTLFYWIPLCIRKPQAQFQKFSSTHGSPSDRFISSSQSPLLVGIKDEEYLSIWSLYFSVHVSFHFFVHDLPWPCRFVGISITALRSLADLYSGWKGIFLIDNGTFCFILLAKISIIIQ